MKKLFVIIMAAFVSLLASDVCKAQFGSISIGKYGIESISPESFSAVRGAVYLEVTNSSEGFTVSDITGVVYKEGSPFVKGTENLFHVDKGTRKTIISGRASLCEGRRFGAFWGCCSLIRKTILSTFA